ncbi:hypothetical protein [Streptomyces sp. NPDC048473]|uniref:hypothetical protein n=1 Tax=unclassified Streptomyces TaxID=2593676 RepID=UPI00371AF664
MPPHTVRLAEPFGTRATFPRQQWTLLQTQLGVLMVETVVQIFTQMAGGALTSVGTGVGQAVSDIVRERFATDERGRSAVQAVDDRPGSPEATASLRSVLRAELEADPEFARKISAALEEPPPAASSRSVSGSITIDGTTMRGNQTIALGPVTFHNTRNIRLSLVGAALVFLALVILGIYGGTRLVTGGDPGQERAVTALSSADLRQVIPGPGSLPAKWTRPKPPEHLTGRQAPGLVAVEAVDYLMGDPDAELSFIAAGFTDAGKASDFLRAVKKSRDPDGQVEEEGVSVPMPKIGDELWAVAGPASSMHPGGAYLVLRVGTVVVSINGYDTDDQAFATSRLEILARMMTERAQQAQNGQAPTAYVRDA